MKNYALSLSCLSLLTLAVLLVPCATLWAADEEKPAANAKADITEGAGKKDDKKKDSDVSGGRFAGDPVYIHLAPIVLPVITEQGSEQLVTLQIDIEVKDFDVADNIHANMPRVMDALMRALYGGLGQGSLRKGKLVDIAKVKNKAAAALGGILGADSFTDVLIQGVSQRML